MIDLCPSCESSSITICCAHCKNCGEQWYEPNWSMAASNIRYAPVIRRVRVFMRIAAEAADEAPWIIHIHPFSKVLSEAYEAIETELQTMRNL